MYQITTTYDHSAMTALCRASRKTLRRRWNLVVRIIGWFGVCFEALCLLILAWIDALAPEPILILGVLMLPILLALLLFEDHLNAWLGSFATYGYRQETEAVFAEREDHYNLTMPGTAGRWEYGKILRFCETDRYFVFLLDKRHGHVFDKTGFKAGNPDTFRTFITEKTGLAVTFIK